MIGHFPALSHSYSGTEVAHPGQIVTQMLVTLLFIYSQRNTLATLPANKTHTNINSNILDRNISHPFLTYVSPQLKIKCP